MSSGGPGSGGNGFLERLSNPFDEEFELALKDAANTVVPTVSSLSTNSSLRSSQQSSYDEFTANFGRPLTPPKQQHQRRRPVPAERPETEYDVPPVPRPVPKPRLSKHKSGDFQDISQSHSQRKETAIHTQNKKVVNDAPFEGVRPEEPPRNRRLPSPPPRPPPRPAEPEPADMTQENIYSEIEKEPERSLEETSDDNDDDDEVLSVLNEGGTFLNPRLTTIDIRKGFEQLYDQSAHEAEMERELVDFLEQKEAAVTGSSHSNSTDSSQSNSGHCYDSVALPQQQFTLEAGAQVPRTATTLIKNFDPCYERWHNSNKEEPDLGGATSMSTSPSLPPPAASPPKLASRQESSSSGCSSQGHNNLYHRYENVWMPPSEEDEGVLRRQEEEQEDSLLKASNSNSSYSPPSPSPPPLPRRHSNIYTAAPAPIAYTTAAAGDDDEEGASALPITTSPQNSSFTASTATQQQLLAGSYSPVRVQRSASTNNLSLIAKKFSFSKLGFKKFSDQMSHHMSLKPVREKETPASTTITPATALVAIDISSRSSESGGVAVRRKGSSSGSAEAGIAGTKPYSGPLFVFSKSKKGVVQQKWCILSNANLRYYNSEYSLAEPKEMIPLKDVLSINKRAEADWVGKEAETPELQVFDVAFVGKSQKLSVRTFGSASASSRDTWVENLALSLNPRLDTVFPFTPKDVTCDKIGWAYLKVMFAGEWCHSWLALRDRHLFYTLYEGEVDQAEEIDLKKTKKVTLVRDVKNLNAPEPNIAVLVIDFVDRSLYLQCLNEREALHWQNAIVEISYNNGRVLADQQLTKDELPVIVEHCVNFVLRHGCLTEGIYRHSGVKTKIDRLLEAFRGNAWAVQISREDFSEHDVANTLKRFMRTLSEPLLTEVLRDKWMKASKIIKHAEKIERYHSLLSRLPDINLRTLRRLVGHLRTVTKKSERNRMSSANLAAIWGPTLLTVDGQAAIDFAQTSGEVDVCRDLIDLFADLFDVSPEETAREEEIMRKQENFNRNPNPVKLSGEMMMFVYIDTKSGGDCISVAVTPKMTAHELQKRVLRKAKYTKDTSGFLLHEVVLAGQLERPIHYNELIYEVTLKWWQWSDADRRDVYLLLKRNTFFEEALPCAIPPLSIFGEAFFSNNSKSGSFKRCQMSMKNARITRSKEAKGGHGHGGQSHELDSWDIEKIIWYFGCEAKRHAPHQLNVTFIERGVAVERSKERPFFGRTLSFDSRELFIKWVAAMLVAEHQGDIVAPETLLSIEEEDGEELK